MFIFVEEFIEKKIKIAEYLYIKKGNLDFETFQKKYSISKSTFKRYLQEINMEYTHYYTNGNLYNTYSLTRIIRKLLDQSDRLALCKAIAFSPGRDARYYQDLLLLSPAKFARLIAQIKTNLISFHMTVEIDSGYWIKGKHEYEVIFLFAYLTTLYRTDKSELELKLSSNLYTYYQQVSQCELLFEHPFEVELLRTIYLIALLRSSQQIQNEQIIKQELQDLICFLQHTLNKNQKQYQQKIQIILDTLYQEEILPEKRKELAYLLYKVAFYITIFPYKFSVLSLRQEFMVEKMYEDYPTRKPLLETFILRLEQLTTIPLTKRKHSLIHFILAMDILTFEHYKPFYLGIYSTLGKQHLEFLTDQVQFLSSYFEHSFTVIPLSNELDHLNYKKNMIILTNTAIETCEVDRQYLISDFLTLEEFGEFGVWLHKKTSYTRKY